MIEIHLSHLIAGVVTIAYCSLIVGFVLGTWDALNTKNKRLKQ